MKQCQRCESERLISVCSKASDLHSVIPPIPLQSQCGYLPYDLGIGGGDYVDIEYCLECGQIQGEWPLPLAEIEAIVDEDDVRR